MKIEAGKFYRTRNGQKAIIYSTTGRAMRHIHGCIIESGSNEDSVLSWYGEGCFYNDGERSAQDLISEWVERPRVDWGNLAAWHQWAAMDGDGKWFSFTNRPALGTSYWMPTQDDSFCDIPPHFFPTFSGDWKDSLIGRACE